jgi:PAS domain S-box-containing protein
LKINPKGTDLLGYSAEELRQTVFMEVVALDDLNAVREAFDEMEKGRGGSSPKPGFPMRRNSPMEI